MRKDFVHVAVKRNCSKFGEVEIFQNSSVSEHARLYDICVRVFCAISSSIEFGFLVRGLRGRQVSPPLAHRQQRIPIETQARTRLPLKPDRAAFRLISHMSIESTAKHIIVDGEGTRKPRRLQYPNRMDWAEPRPRY